MDCTIIRNRLTDKGRWEHRCCCSGLTTLKKSREQSEEDDQQESVGDQISQC